MAVYKYWAFCLVSSFWSLRQLQSRYCELSRVVPGSVQGSKNLLSNTRQGGSKRKVLVAKVAVELKFQSPN